MSLEENRKKLASLIKDKPSTPIQEVKPTQKREGFHINAWIPAEYEKPIKHYCVDKGISIRDFLIETISEKLKSK